MHAQKVTFLPYLKISTYHLQFCFSGQRRADLLASVWSLHPDCLSDLYRAQCWQVVLLFREVTGKRTGPIWSNQPTQFLQSFIYLFTGIRTVHFFLSPYLFALVLLTLCWGGFILIAGPRLPQEQRYQVRSVHATFLVFEVNGWSTQTNIPFMQRTSNNVESLASTMEISKFEVQSWIRHNAAFDCGVHSIDVCPDTTKA